jgi:hypothetical protein
VSNNRNHFSLNRGEFVRVAGAPVMVEIEYATSEAKVDHVWIDINAPERLRLAVNTLSRRNRDAGFDSRIRVGLVREPWIDLPPRGVYSSTGLDYDEIEAGHNVFYEFHDKSQMEKLLCEKARAAVFIEAWGELYARDHPGVHQIHSRRASCAVPEEVAGRDGALKFYYQTDHAAELLLIKFCGQ